MRILQVMAGARHGGAELFFERLVLALARAGVQQQAAIRTAPDRAGKLRAAGIETHEMRFGGWLDFATRPALQRLITDYQPDVVLSWMSRATQKLPPRSSGQVRPVYCARLGGYYPLKYYRHCDHLIGNTMDIVNYLVAEGWPAARAHYLPNFVQAAKAPATPRHLFNTPADAPLLLAMGRLHPNKGFDVLLAALAQLPKAYLWLAGAGPEEAALKKTAQDLGIHERVKFLGWRDDGAALMAAADMLVCPSRIEPLGNVIIEAWAQSKPVVAARAVGPAALIEDGVTGLLAACEDMDALAGALQRLCANPALADELAAAGHNAWQQNYTEAVAVARYLQFFDEVTG